MKALVFEDVNGIKNFIVFETLERLFDVFSKICDNSGRKFCASEEQFESLKSEIDYELLSEIIYKKFLGMGIYDWDGNIHDKIIQPEGSYWIEDYTEQSKDVKLIQPTRVKLEFIFLN